MTVLSKDNAHISRAAIAQKGEIRERIAFNKTIIRQNAYLYSYILLSDCILVLLHTPSASNATTILRRKMLEIELLRL